MPTNGPTTETPTVFLPDTLDAALSLAKRPETRATARDALMALAVFPSTEVYIRDLFGDELTVAPGLVLWALFLAGFIGAVDVRFPTQRCADGARRFCKAAYWNPQLALAVFRDVFRLPLPRAVNTSDPRIGPADVLTGPDDIEAAQIIDATFHRALRFFNDFILHPAGIGTSDTCPRLASGTLDAHSSIKLFVIACAAHAWHTERSYDKLRIPRKEHTLDEPDPFFQHIVYWRPASRSPPALAHPDDISHTITLASICCNTFMAAYAGIENPFNMVGAVEHMRHAITNWTHRTTGKLVVNRQ